MIEQVYYTHCTYGSSAIKKRGARELENQPLGYSVCAGSLTGEPLTKSKEKISRVLSYKLPSGYSRDEILQLNPDEAPRQLLFLPAGTQQGNKRNLPQLVAQVSHRPQDTAGRPGSYFGHVLLLDSNTKESDQDWSIQNCLQLWGAENWVDTDAGLTGHELESLDSFDALREQNRTPIIDDELLLRFLTAASAPEDDGDVADSYVNIVPDHWKSKTPRERQVLVTTLLRAFFKISQSTNANAALLVVAEPAFAALLFYAVVKLLPRGPLTQQLGFSTYENDPQRLRTQLAATTFCDPTADDLPDQLYRSEKFIVNTFNDKSSELTGKLRDLRYPEFIVGMLAREGCWQPVDALLDEFQALLSPESDESKPASTRKSSYIKQLEEFTRGTQLAGELLADGPVTSEWNDWTASSRKRLADQLVSDLVRLEHDSPIWQSLLDDKTRLFAVLELIGTDATSSEPTESLIVGLLHKGLIPSPGDAGGSAALRSDQCPAAPHNAELDVGSDSDRTGEIPAAPETEATPKQSGDSHLGETHFGESQSGEADLADNGQEDPRQQQDLLVLQFLDSARVAQKYKISVLSEYLAILREFPGRSQFLSPARSASLLPEALCRQEAAIIEELFRPLNADQQQLFCLALADASAKLGESDVSRQAEAQRLLRRFIDRLDANSLFELLKKTADRKRFLKGYSESAQARDVLRRHLLAILNSLHTEKHHSELPVRLDVLDSCSSSLTHQQAELVKEWKNVLSGFDDLHRVQDEYASSLLKAKLLQGKRDREIGLCVRTIAKHFSKAVAFQPSDDGSEIPASFVDDATGSERAKCLRQIADAAVDNFDPPERFDAQLRDFFTDAMPTRYRLGRQADNSRADALFVKVGLAAAGLLVIIILAVNFFGSSDSRENATEEATQGQLAQTAPSDVPDVTEPDDSSMPDEIDPPPRDSDAQVERSSDPPDENNQPQTPSPTPEPTEPVDEPPVTDDKPAVEPEAHAADDSPDEKQPQGLPKPGEWYKPPRHAGSEDTPAAVAVAEVRIDTPVLPEIKDLAQISAKMKHGPLRKFEDGEQYTGLHIHGLEWLNEHVLKGESDSKDTPPRRLEPVHEGTSLIVRLSDTPSDEKSDITEKKSDLCSFQLTPGGLTFSWRSTQDKSLREIQRLLELCVVELVAPGEANKFLSLVPAKISRELPFNINKGNFRARIPEDLIPHQERKDRKSLNFDLSFSAARIKIENMDNTTDDLPADVIEGARAVFKALAERRHLEELSAECKKPEIHLSWEPKEQAIKNQLTAVTDKRKELKNKLDVGAKAVRVLQQYNGVQLNSESGRMALRVVSNRYRTLGKAVGKTEMPAQDLASLNEFIQEVDLLLTDRIQNLKKEQIELSNRKKGLSKSVSLLKNSKTTGEFALYRTVKKGQTNEQIQVDMVLINPQK